MLPGKKFTADDVLAILRRRIWLVLVPMALTGAAAAFYVRTIPNEYSSATTIMVIPQRISEALVRNTIASSIEDRLPSIRAQVLSRTSLERIISEFDLYPELRQTRVMEDVVAMMSGNIAMDVSGARNDAFVLGFTADDPTKVQQVAERLGRLVIDQSLSYRSDLIEDTTTFLDAELLQRRSELEAVDQRLAAYQRQHAGELPSQQAGNIQQLQNANTRVQAAVDAINRARQSRLILERQRADVETQPASMAVLTGQAPAAGSTLDQLTVAQQQVAALEARGFKPGHPDLDAAARRVRDLGAQLAQESSGGPDVAPVTPAEASRQARIRDLQDETDEIDRQIARSQAEEASARGVVDATQARVNASPMRGAELTSLTRDYEIIESSYRDLLQKREAARLSANLEQRQVGEQFRIVDPARVPERPSSPNRPRLTLLGLAFGLGLGVAMAGLLEVRDRTLRTDEDIALVLDLPVLAVVPVMESADERRRQAWKRLLLNGTCAVVVIGGLSAVAYALAG